MDTQSDCAGKGARPTPREDTRKMRLRNFPCWVMGHTFRVKAGDKQMLVCQRCGTQELLAMKQMRDNADRPWA